MRIAYFDCFSGISGDMVLGALVDAGLDGALLQAELDKLGLPHLSLDVRRVVKHGIAATQAEVRLGGTAPSPEDEHHLEPDSTHAHPDPGSEHAYDHGHSHDAGSHHAHQHLEDILALIGRSALDQPVKDQASRIFQRLAEAEAQVHGASPAEVHLHEVGALDAVADIVGAVAGLRLLGVDQVYSSPLRCGTGMVSCAHGRYPVPVPGVLALCRDVPMEQTGIRSELITPTGAAIVTTLAVGYGPAPPFRQERVGYGAGRRDLAEIPNLLRVRLGETTPELLQDQVVQIEANVDDMNPEVYGYLFELLLERGALDVYVAPVHMKKGRPGCLLSVLAGPDRMEALIATILRETTTIGVRYHWVSRRKLERHVATVSTPYGPVRVKVCLVDGRPRPAPEYEDCAALARQRQVPILSVYAAARAAALPEE